MIINTAALLANSNYCYDEDIESAYNLDDYREDIMYGEEVLLMDFSSMPYAEKKELLKKFKLVVEDLLDHYENYTDEEKTKIKPYVVKSVFKTANQICEIKNIEKIFEEKDEDEDFSSSAEKDPKVEEEEKEAGGSADSHRQSGCNQRTLCKGNCLP